MPNDNEEYEDGQLNGRRHGLGDGADRAGFRTDVPTFNSRKDDFVEWAELFENAVFLSTNTRDAANLALLCRKWLPLKLDQEARAALKQAISRDWNGLKTEMVGLLIDPQEKAQWQARKSSIKWDGKETMHQLAARVKRAVDKFERDMPQAFKDREYYLRFKDAFESKIRKAIVGGCKEGEKTLSGAKEAAIRYFTMKCEDDDDEKEQEKRVTFANSTFHPDRATGIENMIAGVATQVENLAVSFRGQDVRMKATEDRLGRIERHLGLTESAQGGFTPPRAGRQLDQRSSNFRQQSPNRGNASRNYGGERSRGASGDRSQGYPNSPQGGQQQASQRPRGSSNNWQSGGSGQRNPQRGNGGGNQGPQNGGNRNRGYGNSGGQGRQNSGNFRAIDTADEDSEFEEESYDGMTDDFVEEDEVQGASYGGN